ncbi:MAG: YezD family protein [Chloroflexi bacterium]|nr:YezD family protein [Chloroflexota bacterium]
MQRTAKGLSEVSREETAVLAEVLAALRSIRFGTVQMTVQDGKVVQIDKTEKMRLDRPRL